MVATVAQLQHAKATGTDESYFSMGDAARLAGVRTSRLKRWIGIGVATPTQRVVTPEHEIIASGFTLTDVGYLHLLGHLVDGGETLEHAVRILYHFMARFGPPSEKWKDAFVGIGGPGAPSVVAFAPDPYLATLPIPGIEGAGQRYFDLMGVLLTSGVALESLLVPDRFREFVEINPKKEGGHPVVRGTRIQTATVRAIAEKYGNQAVTRDYYPHIPEDAVEPVIEFEHFLDRAA